MLFLWRTFFKYEGNIGYLKITIIIEKEKLFFLFCQKNYTNNSIKGG